jgi:hypothetical protein
MMIFYPGGLLQRDQYNPEIRFLEERFGVMARFPWLLLLRIRDLLRYVKLREILYHRPIVGKTFRRHVFSLSTGLDAVLPKLAGVSRKLFEPQSSERHRSAHPDQ